MNLSTSSPLRRRLLRPWSRGAVIVVTAVVAASVGYAVARGQHAGELNPAPTPMAEESWLEESIRYLDPLEDTPLVRSLADALPEGAPPETEVLLGRYPNQDWRQSELVAVPRGDYEVYAACEFVDPRINELTGVSVAVMHGSEQPVGGEFNLDCGRGPVLTDHQISYGRHFTLIVSAYPQDPAFESATGDVDVDGEQVDAGFLVAIYLVPR